MKIVSARAPEMNVFHGDELRRCARCGQPFIFGGNRAKYCAECKAIGKTTYLVSVHFSQTSNETIKDKIMRSPPW